MSVKTVQAVINGQTHTLTYNAESQKWEATITAPNKSSYNQENHYYAVTVTAEDDAGNRTTVTDTDITLGESLRLTVKEKVKPVITITSPTASANLTNNKPQIEFNVTDDDSGVNADTIKVTIDDGEAITEGITKTQAEGGYTCTYTPTASLADGSHTIKIDASDNDGNAAEQKSVTFKVDTVPPMLSVTSPADNLITNEKSVTVSGTTNDATSSPVTVTIQLNSGEAEAVTVNDDGTFEKVLTLESGTNTITVTATDGAGKTTTVTRTVKVDSGAPVIREVTLTPNPVDAGKTYIISVDAIDE